jgi:hypothetical protein
MRATHVRSTIMLYEIPLSIVNRPPVVMEESHDITESALCSLRYGEHKHVMCLSLQLREFADGARQVVLTYNKRTMVYDATSSNS